MIGNPKYLVQKAISSQHNLHIRYPICKFNQYQIVSRLTVKCSKARRIQIIRTANMHRKIKILNLNESWSRAVQSIQLKARK